MEKLMEILENLRSDVDFDNEKSLIDGGILDSFDILSLVADISDEFDVNITPADLKAENFNSTEAMWKLIEKLSEE